jgi:hypothetical protein
MKKGFENTEDYGTYPSNIYSIFTAVIAALRLFRGGNVGIYSMHRMIQLNIPLIPDSTGLYAQDLGITLGDYYILDSNQMKEFEKFWEKYGSLLIHNVLDNMRFEHDKYSQIKVAMHNFLHSYVKRDDDEFVDFMKSLMALLFLNTEIQTTQHRNIFIRRLTNLLEQDGYDPNAVREEAEKLFVTFSQITGDRDLEGTDISKLREYTVQCIIKYLDAMKSDTFSHESFIRSVVNDTAEENIDSHS